MQQTLISCQSANAINWIDLAACPVTDPLIVYSIQIAEFDAHTPRLTAFLRSDESARAARYHQPKDRQRFIVARAALRMLLSSYTRQRPVDIEFVTGVAKKPALRGFTGVHYNVSHSGNRVLIAVGNQPVGIDVEQVDPDFDYRAIVLHSFSPEERDYIGESATSRSRFYRLWTRKEALAKATARGIDDDFWRVPSLDGRHWLPGDWLGTADDWTVSSFTLADEYVASVARPGPETEPLPAFVNVGPALLDRVG
ncbi:MAG: 4'-phosphopantetheinyl transferase superfamily protein [Bacteroidetes bacterium]|nr:4'-phosphopantetheinyl transferase superfamily protein [Fibrella sp.]